MGLQNTDWQQDSSTMNLTPKWKTKRKRKWVVPRPEEDLEIAQSNPVRIGALGTASKDREKWLSEIGAHVIQNHCREHDYRLQQESFTKSWSWVVTWCYKEDSAASHPEDVFNEDNNNNDNNNN